MVGSLGLAGLSLSGDGGAGHRGRIVDAERGCGVCAGFVRAGGVAKAETKVAEAEAKVAEDK